MKIAKLIAKVVYPIAVALNFVNKYVVRPVRWVGKFLNEWLEMTAKISTNLAKVLIFPAIIVLLGIYSPPMLQEGKLLDNPPPYNTMDAVTSDRTEQYGEIVRLHDEDGDFFCSGVVISNDYILTAGHCLSMRKNMKIFDDKIVDTGATGVRAAYNSRADLGLVQGDFKKFKKAPMSRYGFMGTTGPYATCGSQYGDSPICVNYTPTSNLHFSVAGIGSTFPGMSGGPVFDRSTGIVVGVNSRVSGPNAVVAPTNGIYGIMFKAGIVVK